MFFNHIFLLKDFYKNNFVPELDEPHLIIIPIHKDLWENKAHYLKKLNLLPLNFCFGLLSDVHDYSKSDLEHFQDDLSIYFFLPNYIKKSGAYLIISDLENGKNNVTINDIEEILSKQGIAPISKNYVYEANENNNEFSEHCFYSPELNEVFANELNTSEYKDIFKKILTANAIKKNWILPVHDQKEFDQKIARLNTFKDWVANNESYYLDLFLEHQQLNSDYLRLENENKKLRFRIDNYNDYLKLLRETAIWHVEEYHRIHNEKQWVVQQSLAGNKTGAPLSKTFDSNTTLPANIEEKNELEYLKANRDNILNWYLKEYESLPLWYKRLGHVIKVMLGKRSIKSLYH